EQMRVNWNRRCLKTPVDHLAVLLGEVIAVREKSNGAASRAGIEIGQGLPKQRGAGACANGRVDALLVQIPPKQKDGTRCDAGPPAPTRKAHNFRKVDVRKENDVVFRYSF